MPQGITICNNQIDLSYESIAIVMIKNKKY